MFSLAFGLERYAMRRELMDPRGISLTSKPFSLCLDSSGNENVRVRSCLSLTRFCGSDCTASLGAFIYAIFLSAGTDQADCLDPSRLP